MKSNDTISTRYVNIEILDIIQLDPNLISAYNNLRDVLRMQKKFNEAEQVYQSMQRVTAK